MFCRCVGVGTEVADALELVGGAYRCIFERRLQIAFGYDQRLGVEIVFPRGLTCRCVVRVFGLKERIEQTYLCLECVCCRYPMDDTLYTATVARRAVARKRVVGAVQFDDVARSILDDLVALDKVGVAQTYLVTRGETEILFGRIIHKVVALDIDDLRERHLARTCGSILWIIDRFAHLDFALLPIGDDNFERIQHSHTTLGDFVQILAHAVLHLGKVNDVVALGNSDHFGKCAYRCRRIALAAQCADCRHARIVPTHDNTLLDEFEQVAFGHHRICQIQPGKLVLVRRIDFERINKPIVKRTMHVEFERTNRVRYALNRVALTVGIVVHRIDAPFVARAVMLGVDDTVHNRVAEEHIRVRHVDFGTQHLRAVGKFTVLHADKEVEILLDRAVAPRRLLARFGDGTAIFANLLLRLVIDISQPFFD